MDINELKEQEVQRLQELNLKQQQSFKIRKKQKKQTIWWGICLILILSSLVAGIFYMQKLKNAGDKKAVLNSERVRVSQIKNNSSEDLRKVQLGNAELHKNEEIAVERVPDKERKSGINIGLALLLEGIAVIGSLLILKAVIKGLLGK